MKDGLDPRDEPLMGLLTHSLGRLGCFALVVLVVGLLRSARQPAPAPDPAADEAAPVASPGAFDPDAQARTIVEYIEAGRADAAQVFVHSLREPDALVDGVPPLYAAAYHGSLGLSFSLLERGASVDARTEPGRHTPLIGAALGGHRDVVHLLLDRGADPNARSSLGRTALGEAAFHGHLEVVEALLLRGARVDAQDALGGTPLIFAAVADRPAVIERLLRAGASVDLPDASGHTPLHVALIKGHAGATRALLAGGANPRWSVGGASARDLAAGSPELLELVEGAIAAVSSPADATGGR